MHKKQAAIENCISFEHLIRSERENIKLNKLRYFDWAILSKYRFLLVGPYFVSWEASVPVWSFFTFLGD